MQTLTFKAEGQRLERTDKLKPVVGSKGYLRCEFELDEEWDGMNIAVRFITKCCEKAALLEDGACMVPDHSARGKWFKVALMGVDDKTVITTNAVTVFQEVL